MHLDIRTGVPVDVHYADQCADQHAGQDQDVYVMHGDLRIDLCIGLQSLCTYPIVVEMVLMNSNLFLNSLSMSRKNYFGGLNYFLVKSMGGVNYF